MAATGDNDLIMEDELDALRHIVKSFGSLDEGSELQALNILSALSIQNYRLTQAIYNRYPHLRDAVNEGLI